MVGVFLLQVGLFWLLFHLDESGIDGARPAGLPKPMAYSLQTLLGASFGSFTPNSAYVLAVSALESLAGILTIAVVTALFLARLLQTEAPLIFSKKLCLSSLTDGHLFCRFATHDPSNWLNVRYSLSLFMDVEIEPNIWQRKIVQLELMNPETPQLSLTATITHASMRRVHSGSFPSRSSGAPRCCWSTSWKRTDEITGSPLLQIHSYRCDDIAVDRKFTDLIGVDHRGGRRVFIDRLDQIGPVDPRSP